MFQSDEALALAASKGDRRAYETLLSAHYDRIFALFCRLCGDFHEAQDLTQDLCLSLPARLAGFRGQARLTTWLYRVVINAAHDRRRSSAVRRRYHEAWGEWEVDRQAVAKADADAAAWLLEALDSLPEALRETAGLALDGDLTQAQIAEILGVSVGTISWRMSEVKKHLRWHASTESPL